MVGEHIRALKGGRWSHAIDCGDETVLHLAEEGARRVVRRSYRPEFIAGAEVVEVVRHRQRTFPGNEVVARAWSRIADPALASTFSTSEAFACWCATGRAAAAAEGSAPPAPAARARGSAPRAAAAASAPPKKRRPRAPGARRAPRVAKAGTRGSGAPPKGKARGSARGAARASGAAGPRRRRGAKRR